MPRCPFFAGCEHGTSHGCSASTLRLRPLRATALARFSSHMRSLRSLEAGALSGVTLAPMPDAAYHKQA